jgi:SAM-dependent methyltransferase
VLLHEFQRRGFRCTGIESSTDALDLATTLAHEASAAVSFRSAPDSTWRASFDTAFAFDVLEHIQDDVAALHHWATWLRPGGHLFLSVPAHQKSWTAGDEWAGHFRRYEREGLQQLLCRSGFEVEQFECYGFPLTNLSERLGAISYEKRLRAEKSAGGGSRKANNERSGIDRRQLLRLYPLMTSWPGRASLGFFMQLQRLFLATDLGSGYLVRARRAC